MRVRVATIFLIWIAAAWIAVGCRGTAPPVGAEASPPRASGIVLVTVDQWWDPSSRVDPFLADSLPGSVRFTNASTPCPQTRPAISALLTGQTPDRTGIRDDLSQPLPPDIPYLPALLSNAGWQTGAFIGISHVGHGSGFERGFEIFDAPREMPIAPFRHRPRLRPAEEMISNLSTWAEGLAPDRPFFAWVHLAFGGQDARGGAGAPPREIPAGAGDAWERLSRILREEGPLGSAAILVVGTAGKIDTAVGASSGYFLTPEVLRVPLLYRSSRGGPVAAVEAGAPIGTADLAALLALEGGLDATFPDGRFPPEGSGDSRVRFAWTWRGAREFDWPVEAAAVRGDALLVLTGGEPGRILSWSTGETLPETAGVGLAEALASRPRWDEERSPRPSELPAEVDAALSKAGISIPSGERVPPAPPRDTRMELAAAVLEARRVVQGRDLPGAIRAFDEVAEKDPGNSGVRVEPAQILSLVGRNPRARERFEAVLRLHPFHAEAWHWLGHIEGAQQAYDRAEAVLALSDFLSPHNGDLLYDRACVRSLAGDLEGAETFLRKSWAAGFRNSDHFETDPDLRNLRADPRYARFMQEVVR